MQEPTVAPPAAPASPASSPAPAPPGPPGPAVPADGRAARALRTREAIVDACIAMVEEGDVRPTAPRVAERAGVSVRSVFQHFDDLPSLHIAVTQRIAQRMSAMLVPADTSLPLAARIATFVQHRSALLEAVTPFRRAAQVHGPFAPEIRLAVAEGETYLSREVEATFAPELDGRSDADRAELLDALDAATSWPTWDVLRSDRGVPAERARAVVVRTVTALLSEGSPPGASPGSAGGASSGSL